MIKDLEGWPQWWKGVKKVRVLAEGDDSGLGKKAVLTWRSFLPYTLTFEMEVTGVRKHHSMHGYTSGELSGTGTWIFNQEGSEAVLAFHWDVRTTKPWMNTFSFLLRPFFIWNHHLVMKWGRTGLLQKISGKSVS